MGTGKGSSPPTLAPVPSPAPCPGNGGQQLVAESSDPIVPVLCASEELSRSLKTQHAASHPLAGCESRALGRCLEQTKCENTTSHCHCCYYPRAPFSIWRLSQPRVTHQHRPRGCRCLRVVSQASRTQVHSCHMHARVPPRPLRRQSKVSRRISSPSQGLPQPHSPSSEQGPNHISCAL